MPTETPSPVALSLQSGDLDATLSAICHSAGFLARAYRTEDNLDAGIDRITEVASGLASELIDAQIRTARRQLAAARGDRKERGRWSRKVRQLEKRAAAAEIAEALEGNR